MARKNEVQEEVAPNLIPMIDIMFLLLLFLMLGAEMGHKELEDVVLPLATAIKEDKDADEGKDRLTVNVFHRYANEVQCPTHSANQPCREDRHWRIHIKGNDYTEVDKLKVKLKEESEVFKDQSLKEKDSERRVMVRADGGAPYGFVQDVMGACATVGIYQIECGAARPPAESGAASGH
jgi:biopolymer transport protein ExbD